MRRTYVFALALLALISVPTVSFSQGGQMGTPMEASRGVAGGGVSVPGWTGKIDAKEEAAGRSKRGYRQLIAARGLSISSVV